MADATGAMPTVGSRAPAFTLRAIPEGSVRLTDLKGRRVVVYFYPKDDTEGCSIEAREFQGLLPEFERANVAVLGISPDPIEMHHKFARKCELTFPLLSDPEHRVADKYGVWVEKQLYGRTYWGVRRATFLIGPNGRIEHVWPNVRPRGHAAAVWERCRQD